MKALAYALAGCLVLLIAPTVTAECPGGTCPEDVVRWVEDWPYCSIFDYYLEPPYYRLDPECALPPG